MTLQIQNIDMVPSYTPYERPPQSLTLWSAIPRGLQSFIVDGQQVVAKAQSDTALLNLKGTLPPNFGYVMNDLNVSLAKDRAHEWSDSIQMNLQNFYRAPLTLSVGLAGNWVQPFPLGPEDNVAGGLATRSIQVIQPWPAFPIIGTEGTTGVLINIHIFDDSSAVSAAGTISTLMSFWQFDLEQIRKYPINSPLPTHAR